MKRAVLLSLLLSFPFTTTANGPVSRKNDVGHRNFSQAKTILPTIFKGMNTTFYCGCKYTGKTVDHSSCGYKVRKDANRAGKVEWEHVVPAWAIGHQRQCWQKGGRGHCNKADAVYRKAEGDLHNLTPAIGEINNDRSNYRFTVWENNPAMYGQCQMVVDFAGRRAQPPQWSRGKIARITFYMADTYKLQMNKQERRLYCAWAKTYPVDNWETVRDKRIKAMQGNSNRFVSDPASVTAM